MSGFKAWIDRSISGGTSRKTADEGEYIQNPDERGRVPTKLVRSDPNRGPQPRTTFLSQTDETLEGNSTSPRTQSITSMAPNHGGEIYDDDNLRSTLSHDRGGEDPQIAIGRIKHQLLKLKKEYTYLNFDDPGPLSKARPAQIVRCQQTLIDDFTRLTRSYNDTNAEWATDKQTMFALRDSEAQLKKDLENNTRAGRLALEKRDRTEKSLLKRLEDERKAATKAEKELRKGLDDQEKAHSKREKTIRKECEDAIKQVERNSDIKWKEHYKSQIEELSQRVRDQQGDIDYIKRVAHEREQRLLTTKQEEYDRLQARKDEAYAILESKHQAEQLQLAEIHAAEILSAVKESQKKIEDLRSALVDQAKKDYFKALGDGAISSQFSAICNIMDEFSRLTWDTSLGQSWPFPSQAFYTSDNDRRTKRYIIINMLWVILFERIFCTPFRILGVKGKALEDTWNKEFGDWKSVGSPQPNLTRKSEKWRYESMKNISDDLSQKSDNDTKRVYEQHLTDTCVEMCQQLEQITQVTGNDRQSMAQLVNKAAKFWLEIGQQRFRVCVLMSESGGEPIRNTIPDLHGSLRVVVTPGLRRWGNSQGDRLEEEETVMGCKGNFAVEYLTV